MEGNLINYFLTQAQDMTWFFEVKEINLSCRNYLSRIVGTGSQFTTYLFPSQEFFVFWQELLLIISYSMKNMTGMSDRLALIKGILWVRMLGHIEFTTYIFLSQIICSFDRNFNQSFSAKSYDLFGRNYLSQMFWVRFTIDHLFDPVTENLFFWQKLWLMFSSSSNTWQECCSFHRNFNQLFLTQAQEITTT